MASIAVANRSQPVAQIKKLLFNEARHIIEEDRATCRKIGDYGASLIKNGATILTVCNDGILATIDYGTALGVLYRAKEKGKRFKVFACETRPLLQGARLTTWELKQKGIDVTLICDNMAATLMRQGRVDAVITGADRIVANGDTANKIGTYSLAVLARYHRVPFYVAAPSSTFDLQAKSGRDIEIEQRPPDEVTGLFFKKPIAAANVSVYNPAFDVTDHGLISAIITDKGIVRQPYRQQIKKILAKE
jgi:methylthioribose-1-phosphate isomerase